MDAEQLTAYFKKKIAKEIHFDFRMIWHDAEIVRFYYGMETIAVTDDAVNVLLNLRYMTERGKKGGVQRHCGETWIPLEDGDTLVSVFEMAVAGAEFRENSLQMEAVDGDAGRFAKAYSRLQSRLEAASGAAPGGPR